MDTDLISCNSIKLNLSRLNDNDTDKNKKRGKWSEDEVILINIGLTS
jgi:hypothetical protein